MGADHRFVDVTEDLQVLVVFAPPDDPGGVTGPVGTGGTLADLFVDEGRDPRRQLHPAGVTGTMCAPAAVGRTSAGHVAAGGAGKPTQSAPRDGETGQPSPGTATTGGTHEPR